MDDFIEWERFTDILESSPSYSVAWKRYKKERQRMALEGEARELRKLQQDIDRDAAEELGRKLT